MRVYELAAGDSSSRDPTPAGTPLKHFSSNMNSPLLVSTLVSITYYYSTSVSLIVAEHAGWDSSYKPSYYGPGYPHDQWQEDEQDAGWQESLWQPHCRVQRHLSQDLQGQDGLLRRVPAKAGANASRGKSCFINTISPLKFLPTQKLRSFPLQTTRGNTTPW